MDPTRPTVRFFPSHSGFSGFTYRRPHCPKALPVTRYPGGEPRITVRGTAARMLRQARQALRNAPL
jgi:hypothetical protein